MEKEIIMRSQIEHGWGNVDDVKGENGWQAACVGLSVSAGMIGLRQIDRDDFMLLPLPNVYLHFPCPLRTLAATSFSPHLPLFSHSSNLYTPSPRALPRLTQTALSDPHATMLPDRASDQRTSCAWPSCNV